jgi:hypothetical protein
LRPILANDNKQTKITPTTGLGTAGVKEKKSKKEPADRRRRRKKEQVIYRGGIVSLCCAPRASKFNVCV